LVLGLMSWQTNRIFGVVVHDVIAQTALPQPKRSVFQ
jgi:hypothetical protein